MGLSTESVIFDPYEILGLPREASASAIRTAYKKLALKYHPDKHRDEKQKVEMSEQFTRIQEAYETLNDPRKKQEYDESCEIEAEIQESMKRAQEMKSKLKKDKEEKKKRDTERKAQAEYERAKTKEEILIAEALKVQAQRKMSAFQNEQRRASGAGDDRAFRKAEEKRKKNEKKFRDEEMARKEREEFERLERIRREEEHKRHDIDQERRDRERRKDRADKGSYTRNFEFEEETYGGFEHDPAGLGASGRGRSSKERLRADPLAVPREHSPRPRDNSRQRGGGGGGVGRDRSRNRDKERDHSRHREGPRDKERERVRQMFDNSAPGAPRRASSDPYDSSYLRTPGSNQQYNGSPPSYSHFSGPAPGTRSPPDSPQAKYAGAAPGPSGAYSTPNAKGGRARDRTVPRKHSDAQSYVPREASYANMPEELAHQTPGTRDSGYCSSSNQTPHKNLDSRKSSERVSMNDGKPNSAGNKKYKFELRYVPVEVNSEDDSDQDQSNKGSARGTRHRAASYEEPHPSPRHASASAVETDPNVFEYMVSGSDAHSYPSDKTHFGKPAPHHTRHHSNNQSPPKINLETADIRYVPAGGYPSGGYPTGRHHSTREVPPVGGGSHHRDVPGLYRGATWNG